MGAFVADAWHTLAPRRDDPFGPLAPMLVALTTVTGVVDAFSYLVLGHTFVANMTGNVVFLAFAIAGAKGFSVGSSLAALGAFGVGSLYGGLVAHRHPANRGHLLLRGVAVQIVLVSLAVSLSLGAGAALSSGPRYGLIATLAAAMGVQNALARRLGVPDLTTTVLTLTTTALFADSRLAGGSGRGTGRRLLSILVMFLGALVGALLVVHSMRSDALVVALALLVLVLGAVVALSRGDPAWVTVSPAPSGS